MESQPIEPFPAIYPHLYLIGLTGGIASGKSTVAQYLRHRHQLPVLEADVYAREVVKPGSPVLARLVQRYGPEMLLPQGQLNRSSLGNIIFQNPEERAWVEAQIHPQVQRCFRDDLDRLAQQQTRTDWPNALNQAHPKISGNNDRPQPVILDIPLLFEAGLTDWVTEIWVVYCTPEQQLERLMARNSLTNMAAQDRIQAQLPLGQKQALAHRCLDNTGSIDRLYYQVDRGLAPWVKS